LHLEPFQLYYDEVYTDALLRMIYEVENQVKAEELKAKVLKAKALKALRAKTVNRLKVKQQMEILIAKKIPVMMQIRGNPPRNHDCHYWLRESR
ncbi:MAG: hypothetical protein MKZ99_07805, partial [Candidatus Marinimicrobia bacterium]|nr:hypothetical protein [Candidatus Neomarinimicrobiota bacterium]